VKRLMINRIAFMHITLILTTILFCSAPRIANAQVIDAITQWQILDSNYPENEIEVKYGKPILKSKIIPARLAALKADIVETKSSKIVYPANGQIMQITTGGSEAIYCSIKTIDSRWDKILRRAPNTYICFIDNNNDQNFEYYYYIRRTSDYPLPIIQRARTIGTAIEKANYTIISSAEYANELFLTIEYGHPDFLSTTSQIFLKFGTDDWQLTLDENRKIKRNKYPQYFEFMGSEFSVIAEAKNGAKLAIKKAIPSQPFSLHITRELPPFFFCDTC
jgi:hypothetical protein